MHGGAGRPVNHDPMLPGVRLGFNKVSLSEDTVLSKPMRTHLDIHADTPTTRTPLGEMTLDNLIQESGPDVGTTIHRYDAAGNRIQCTDARGVVVQYTYDALNRRASVVYPGSTACPVHDSIHPMVSLRGLSD